MEKNNISVIGVGKLGLCFALTLEKFGYNILGVDISDEYVYKLNSKILKTSEPNVENYLIESRNFDVTTDINQALDHSDSIFIFVATPSLDNGRYDHSSINNVVTQLIDYGKLKKSKHLIIGCTTMPGYSNEVNEKLNPYGYTVSYNPEFIAQGSVMRDLVNPDILLIGEGSKTAGDLIEKIYRKIVDNSPSVHRMTRIEAEITKIALNCYLTTKISFANMVGDIAKTSGCNPDVILSAIGSDKRIGEKNLKYGFGFGGPCFPRDNRALALFAKDVGLEAEISKASDIANNLHLNFQFNEYKLKYSLSEPIVFSNMAYKPGTTIIEESQKLKLAVMLMEASYSVTIKDYYDIIFQVRKLYGDNFNYEVIDSENSKVQKLH